MTDIDKNLKRINRALERALARMAKDEREGQRVPTRLLEAMSYALLSQGKRLRPTLVLAGARAAGGRPRDALVPACAVEMIHAYSLVHDDLPALDNDDERRGQKTVHRAFDEATALLAGDALLTEAFELLAASPALSASAKPARPRDRVRAIAELARAAGAGGMVGGQQDDITVQGHPTTEREIRSIHQRKTGRLIECASVLGALWIGADAEVVEHLRRYGAAVGLAFQLVDDALDGDGFAIVHGRELTRQMAMEATDRAVGELRALKSASSGPLVDLARRMVARSA